ncbi:uncharacterized protein [Nicotiana sylvestris]|uniref:uncharacterized protein n=1 Tax=Nicotiana sylvestris TaxID=4096 RepID=UPI00388C8C32
MMIKTLIWNIRSVNTQQAFPRVINMQREHNFFVIALIEPFQKKGFINRYRRRLNMDTAYSNINGQLWLLFDAIVKWELVEDTEQQVTVKVFHHDLGQHMIMIFVYAKYEKIGGLPIHPPEYEDFASCINSCGLFDQEYKESPFIWWKGRPNVACIFKRLDRILVNFPFQNMLPTIKVEHIIRIGSDHADFLMTCGEQTANFFKPFRFLNFWAKHATFLDVKLKKLKATLSKWSREIFGDIFKQLAILEDIVRVKEMLFEEEPTIENRIVLQKAQSELKKYLSIEEQYWKKKAGMTRFAEGDRNTSFFHKHVNGKRKKLQLKSIQTKKGVWIEDQE